MNELVIIHKAAELRLGQIWDYTVEKWGEEQADSYLRKLGVCIQGLKPQRHFWRSVKDKRLPGVSFIRCEYHFIFFREMEGRLAVISILHENMDMLTRLREDTSEERK
jgi:toxin ParE1/3/4